MIFLETDIRAWAPTSLINDHRHYCSRATVGSTTVDHLLVVCEKNMVRLHTQQSCLARGVTHSYIYCALTYYRYMSSLAQVATTAVQATSPCLYRCIDTRYSFWMSARVAWSCCYFTTWLVVSLCFRLRARRYASIHAAILFSNVVAESDLSL